MKTNTYIGTQMETHTHPHTQTTTRTGSSHTILTSFLPQVVGDGTQTVGQAVSHVAQDLNLTTFSLALADSQAEVDLDAPAHLLDGDTILLHDAIDTFNPAVGELLLLYFTERRKSNTEKSLV